MPLMSLQQLNASWRSSMVIPYRRQMGQFRTAWWFQTWLLCSISQKRDVILPIDKNIFQDGYNMLKPPTREIQDTADSFNAGSWNIPMQPYVAVSFGTATSLEVAATAAAKGRSLEILQRIQEWCCERSLGGWLRMIYILESMMIALENMYRYSVDCRCEKELLYFE